MKTKNNGFTLLELLVVIGIIAILVALATVSYSATQKQGRDSKRKQDLVAVQNALEQYYSNNYYKYPDGTCRDADTYLVSSWPLDPDTGVDYSGTDTCTTSTYCVCATLESGKGGNSSDSSCSFGTTQPLEYYCVKNLQ